MSLNGDLVRIFVMRLRNFVRLNFCVLCFWILYGVVFVVCVLNGIPAAFLADCGLYKEQPFTWL